MENGSNADLSGHMWSPTALLDRNSRDQAQSLSRPLTRTLQKTRLTTSPIPVLRRFSMKEN
ncbi:unnamed protein product [Hymenolepis diminuta]|uniref:Uncharacterized protein n=1 Tax=Hymenolepis diminuta TaxID=6216 RepID=A0A564Z0C9_HYMDI|nr:unnamed protein product [Hymenolepis diminuta]